MGVLSRTQRLAAKARKAAARASKTLAEDRAAERARKLSEGSGEIAARRMEARKRRASEQEGRTTQKRASIGKATVSAEDIKQATTARQFDAMQRRIDDMDDGMRKRSMQAMLERQRNEFEDMQSEELARASRKSAQANRDRKMRGKVTLPETPFSKGGMAKKYSKGGYANAGASVKPDGKRRK